MIAFPKSPRLENKHLLSMAKGKPCLIQSPICNHGPETTVACHGSGIANGKGMGYKVGDHLTVWGCSACNHYTDAYGGATKAEKKAVFDAGLVRQINAWTDLVATMETNEKDRKAASWALSNIFMRQA